MSYNGKRIAPVAIQALKEALTQIYWYKSDLRSFLTQSLDDPAILARVDWHDHKRNIVTRMVDLLVANQSTHQGVILKLIADVVAINDFSHLLHLENGQEKASNASRAVQGLREQYKSHSSLMDEQRQVEIRRQRALEEQLKNIGVRSKLEELNNAFIHLVSSTEVQQRGYALERLLYSLFELFDLDPRASFRCVGEQIDGAFTFDGTDYIVEAKWQQDMVGIGQLDAFSGKVGRRLDNTLGLYVAINGYSGDAVKIHSAGRSSMILIDGNHLMAVLEGRLDLFQLLLRLRRFAAETGQIYLPIHQILSE